MDVVAYEHEYSVKQKNSDQKVITRVITYDSVNKFMRSNPASLFNDAEFCELIKSRRLVYLTDHRACYNPKTIAHEHICNNDDQLTVSRTTTVSYYGWQKVLATHFQDSKVELVRSLALTYLAEDDCP